MGNHGRRGTAVVDDYRRHRLPCISKGRTASFALWAETASVFFRRLYNDDPDMTFLVDFVSGACFRRRDRETETGFLFPAGKKRVVTGTVSVESDAQTALSFHLIRPFGRYHGVFLPP